MFPYMLTANGEFRLKIAKDPHTPEVRALSAIQWFSSPEGLKALATLESSGMVQPDWNWVMQARKAWANIGEEEFSTEGEGNAHG